MKKTYVAVLAIGTAIAATGATIAIVRARRARQTPVQRLMAKMEPMAERAKVAGEQMVKTATEQYHAFAPVVADALHTVREQAPHAMETLSGMLPKNISNGKKEPAEVKA